MMHIELLDSMGSDLTVVNSARVSFAKYKDTFSDNDERLIKYLAEHQHWTPFSQVQYQVRIKAPIFIARQWFKHMVGITRNEVSRRYVDSEPEFFSPTKWRSKPTDGAKQGSSGDAPSQYFPDLYLKDIVELASENYRKMIVQGICPEQARMILPQCMMTEWIETGSLASAARIYKQRIDPHAQVEIQELAEKFGGCIESIAPVSWRQLTKG